MLSIFHMAMTLAAALAVGAVFARLKVPGGMLVGGIVGAALLNIFFGVAHIPSAGKVFAQIIAGAFIGSGVEKSDISRLRHIVRPAVILLGSYLAVNIAMGLLIWAISPLDAATALFSAVPGGISDIPLIAADMGANAPQVAVLQFVRLVIGIGVFPGMINAICREPEPLDTAVNPPPAQPAADAGTQEPPRLAHFWVTLGVAAIFGVMGKISGIPAGTLVFSLISVIVLKLLWGKVYLPFAMKRFAQLLSGAYIGCSIGWQDLLELRYLLLPAVILAVGYSGFCFLNGAVMKRFCGMSRKEAMLVSTPAGASDMALISMDMGVQSTDLVVLQVLRLVVVSSIFPQVIHLILVLGNLQ